MIKSTDVRVGNILLKRGEIFQIDGMDVFRIDEYNNKDMESFYEPVPLTGEWLERLGFKNIYEDLWQSSLEELFDIDINLGHLWSGVYTGAPIEFVHQVQNLHFALTGQELTVKVE